MSANTTLLPLLQYLLLTKNNLTGIDFKSNHVAPRLRYVDLFENPFNINASRLHKQLPGLEKLILNPLLCRSAHWNGFNKTVAERTK